MAEPLCRLDAGTSRAGTGAHESRAAGQGAGRDTRRRGRCPSRPEEARADALRRRVDELQAGQQLMMDTHARALAEAQDQLERVREAAQDLRQASGGGAAAKGACGVAQGGVAGRMMASRCR